MPTHTTSEGNANFIYDIDCSEPWKYSPPTPAEKARIAHKRALMMQAGEIPFDPALQAILDEMERERKQKGT